MVDGTLELLARCLCLGRILDRSLGQALTAAFGLCVNQLSDIVISEAGVHILQRTA